MLIINHTRNGKLTAYTFTVIIYHTLSNKEVYTRQCLAILAAADECIYFNRDNQFFIQL